jgi:hypothetical protein
MERKGCSPVGKARQRPNIRVKIWKEEFHPNLIFQG